MERRLAAILVADMVGYSRLMAADQGVRCSLRRLDRDILGEEGAARSGQFFDARCRRRARESG